MARDAREAGHEAGFALLIVLWSVVLLALLVTGIAASGRTDTQLAANLRDAAQAEAAADGAVHQAAFQLLDPARPWAADGAPRTIAVPGAAVTLRIEDQAAKVNPNGASRELLRSLLQAVGAGSAADPVAANIVLWRFPRVRPGGLSVGLGNPDAGPSPAAAPYRAAGLDYEPPGAPFESLDELRLVLGMTPELLARLLPHLSLLNDTDPDPAKAGPVVLQALRNASLLPAASPSRAPARPRAVRIVAAAVTPTGARFTRDAGLRLGLGEKEPLLTIAGWGSVPEP